MKTPSPHPPSNERRDFLRTCFRYGGLATLGGIGALLAWRSRRGACGRFSPCGGCPWLAGCDEPKAVETRTRSNHDGTA